jgi:hypothetical protein
VGRQIINTEGAAETIASRRRLTVLALLVLVVAIAAAFYFVRSKGRNVAPAPTTSAGPAARVPAAGHT